MCRSKRRLEDASPTAHDGAQRAAQRRAHVRGRVEHGICAVTRARRSRRDHGELAPLTRGLESEMELGPGGDSITQEECPICFLFFPAGLNRTKCCNNHSWCDDNYSRCYNYPGGGHN